MKTDYTLGVMDDFFLNAFRNKMVQMVFISQLMTKGGSNSAIQQSSEAAMMTARVTAATCQWLLGPCTVNSVELPDGFSCSSGVLVEKCRYLEESKCMEYLHSIHSCKLPTQFKYGVAPSQSEEDKILQEHCLEVCPKASVRKMRNIQVPHTATCPKI